MTKTYREYRDLWTELGLVMREIVETSQELGVSPAQQLSDRLAQVGLSLTVDECKTVLHGMTYMFVDKNATAQLIDSIVGQFECESDPTTLPDAVLARAPDQFQAKFVEICAIAATCQWERLTQILTIIVDSDPVLFATFVRVFWSTVG